MRKLRQLAKFMLRHLLRRRFSGLAGSVKLIKEKISALKRTLFALTTLGINKTIQKPWSNLLEFMHQTAPFRPPNRPKRPASCIISRCVCWIAGRPS
jgi:hypothetical protein